MFGDRFLKQKFCHVSACFLGTVWDSVLRYFRSRLSSTCRPKHLHRRYKVNEFKCNDRWLKKFFRRERNILKIPYLNYSVWTHINLILVRMYFKQVLNNSLFNCIRTKEVR